MVWFLASGISITELLLSTQHYLLRNLMQTTYSVRELSAHIRSLFERDHDL